MARRLPLQSLAVGLAATAIFSGAALAQTAAPAAAPAAEPAKAEPDWTFTSNVGLYSQYVFRGVSQTDEKPAVQGGFDLGHKSGFYVGTWASNISWISDANPAASASMEWDMYGGYKATFADDWGYDLGVLYYWYPGQYPAGYSPKPNTTELYGALSWKWLSLKYSWSANNQTFGIPDSRGSSYLDLTASYDVVDKINDAFGKLTVFGHLGHQWYTGNTGPASNSALNYGDWKVGLSTELYGVTLGAYVTDTNANQALYTNSFGKKLADTQFVGYVQKTF